MIRNGTSELISDPGKGYIIRRGNHSDGKNRQWLLVGVCVVAALVAAPA